MRGDRPSRLLALVVAVAVAVAFADSSIVVLALPDLYSRFATSIVGVSWVVTSYNLVLAGCAFALILVIGRVDVGNLTRAGLVLFCAGSVGAAVSWSLPSLIVFRCVQGAGAAMLIAGALALLSALCGSRARGVAMWITRTRKSDPTPRDQHLVAEALAGSTVAEGRLQSSNALAGRHACRCNRPGRSDPEDLCFALTAAAH